MNASVMQLQQEALEVDYLGSVDFTDSAADAALALLNSDPEQGAGKPSLIRSAAVLARKHNDEVLAIYLDWAAEGWERYLRGLAEAMRKQ